MNDPPTIATRSALDAAAQRVGVAQRAQVEDPGELGARQRQPPHVRPGREDRLVVGDRLLRRERRSLARLGVELQDARPGEDLDVVGDGRSTASRSTGRAGAPWRSAGARTAGRARGRRAAPSRRSPARAAPARRSPRPGRRRRAGRRPRDRPCRQPPGEPGPFGRELLGDRVLEARVEDEQDLVAGLDDRVGLRARSRRRRAAPR